MTATRHTFRLDEAIGVLTRTPDVLRALLGHLPEPWTSATEGPGTWSPAGVVAHLIYGEETDWIPRARIILSDTEDRTFPPFDRDGHRTYLTRPLPELLDAFAGRRRSSLDALTAFALQDADLDRTGIHPEFGTVSLRQHLATWVAHDLDHLGQIARVLAKRYSDDVGPWKQYLSILRERTP